MGLPAIDSSMPETSFALVGMESQGNPTKEKGQPVPMRCPECGARIEVRHSHYPSFACPKCDATICVAPAYLI